MIINKSKTIENELFDILFEWEVKYKSMGSVIEEGHGMHHIPHDDVEVNLTGLYILTINEKTNIINALTKKQKNYFEGKLY